MTLNIRPYAKRALFHESRSARGRVICVNFAIKFRDNDTPKGCVKFVNFVAKSLTPKPKNHRADKAGLFATQIVPACRHWTTGLWKGL